MERSISDEYPDSQRGSYIEFDSQPSSLDENEIQYYEDGGKSHFSDEDSEYSRYQNYEGDNYENDDYFYEGDVGREINDCWLPYYQGNDLADEDEGNMFEDEFDEEGFYDGEDDEDYEDDDYEYDEDYDYNEMNDGDYEYVDIDDQEDPEYLASNEFEFKVLPEKKEMNYTVKEEDYNPEYDLDGDEREWNHDYAKNFKARTKNTCVTHSEISDGKTYKDLLEKIQSKDTKFKDKVFPADDSSMIGFGKELDIPNIEDEIDEKLQYKWQRAAKVFQTQLKVIKKIDPHGIKQGSLGDCYFLSAISAVAEHKDRIKRLMISKGSNKEGVYCVTLCLNGLWQDIIIDDFFPISPDTGKLAFTSTENPEIWVPLIQKAWAKAHGGYMNIDGGYITESVHDLTGAPCATYFTNEGSPDAHWRRILEGERKDFIMGCSTDDLAKTGNDDQDSETGLCGMHAYSLLAAYELVHSRGGSYRVKSPSEAKNPACTRIVKIRNPWGSGEWKGEWNDDDDRWSKQLLKQTDHKKEDDGVFFMNFRDFLKYFADYSICHYRNDYVYSAKQFTSTPSKETTIKFDIGKEGDYFFSIHQVNARFFKKSENYVYTPIKLIVSRIEKGGKNTFVGMVQKCDKEMWFKATCKPGSYVAVVEARWKRKVNQFVFSSYGPEAIKIGETNETKVQESFIENLIIQKAKSDKNKFLNFKKKGNKDIKYRVEHSNDGFGYFFFMNESKDTTLTATVQFTEFRGCKLLPPFSGMKPQIVVLPGEEKLIAYKLLERTTDVKFKLITSFKKGVNNLIDTALEKGTKFERAKNGKNVGISVYVMKHNNGVFYLYQNESKKYVLRETVKFDLSNAKIESIPGKKVSVVVKPGEKYSINIVNNQKGKESDVKIKECKFTIEDLNDQPWSG